MKSFKNKTKKSHPLQLPGLSPWKIKNQTAQSEDQQDYGEQYKFHKRKYKTIDVKKNNNQNQENHQSNLQKLKKEYSKKRYLTSAQFKRYYEDHRILEDKENNQNRLSKRYRDKDYSNCIRFKNLSSPKHRRSFKIVQDKELPKLSPPQIKHTNINMNFQISDFHYQSNQTTRQNSPKRQFKTIQPPSSQPLIPHIASLHHQNAAITGFNLTSSGFSYVAKDKIVVLKDNKAHLIDRPPLQNILKVRIVQAQQINYCKMKAVMMESSENSNNTLKILKNNSNEASLNSQDQLSNLKFDNNSKLLGQNARNCYSGLKNSQKTFRKQKDKKQTLLNRAFNYNIASNEQNYDNSIFAERVFIRTARQNISENKKILQKNQKIKNMIRNGGRRMSIL